MCVCPPKSKPLSLTCISCRTDRPRHFASASTHCTQPTIATKETRVPLFQYVVGVLLPACLNVLFWVSHCLGAGALVGCVELQETAQHTHQDSCEASCGCELVSVNFAIGKNITVMILNKFFILEHNSDECIEILRDHEIIQGSASCFCTTLCTGE